MHCRIYIVMGIFVGVVVSIVDGIVVCFVVGIIVGTVVGIVIVFDIVVVTTIGAFTVKNNIKKNNYAKNLHIAVNYYIN